VPSILCTYASCEPSGDMRIERTEGSSVNTEIGGLACAGQN
jgi:hypothetical protein